MVQEQGKLTLTVTQTCPRQTCAQVYIWVPYRAQLVLTRPTHASVPTTLPLLCSLGSKQDSGLFLSSLVLLIFPYLITARADTARLGWACRAG